LRTTEHGQRQPQKEHKLESVVEREPIHNVEQAFKDGELSEDDPVSEPLSVVNFASAEECLQGVIGGDDETSKVGQELTAEVEDDEEEVEGNKSNSSIDFGNRGLFLEVVERWVLGELTVELGDVVLNAILSRHDCYRPRIQLK